MHKSFLLALAGLMILSAQTLGAPREYDVKFARPDHAGDKFNVTIASGGRRQIIRAGEDPTEDVEAVQFEAKATILDVNAKGDDLKIEYTVSRFFKMGGDKQEKELMPRGSKFVAQWKDGKTVYTQQGKPLAEPLSNDLDSVASLPDPAGAKTDDLYGTDNKQHPGSTWSVNGEKLAQDWKRHHYEFSKDSVKGTVKLEGIEKADGVDCLLVTAQVKVEDPRFNPPDDWNEKGVKAGPIELSLTGMLPIDPSSGQVNMSGTSKYSLIFQRDNLPPVEVRTTRIWELKAIPVK